MRTRAMGGLLGIILATVGSSGCASNRPRYEAQAERDAVVTVESIDVPNRLVKLRGVDGVPFTVRVDESVKDFPQAKVGDQVRVRYRESVAVQLKRPGDATTALEVKEEAARPKPGEPRTATATVQTTETVTVEAIDHRTYVVTVVGPRGRRTVRLMDPALQDYSRKVNAGDKVELTFAEAVAVSLEKAHR